MSVLARAVVINYAGEQRNGDRMVHMFLDKLPDPHAPVGG
jgi:hypothetical protein